MDRKCNQKGIFQDRVSLKIDSPYQNTMTTTLRFTSVALLPASSVTS